MFIRIPNPEESHLKSQENRKKDFKISQELKRNILLDTVGSKSSTGIKWKARKGAS